MSERPRVAILGAGCAGLTVAEELRERGIEDITIFEASARPAGKIQSVAYDGAPKGGRGLFEAGTVFFIPSPTWTKFLDRYGVSPHVVSMPRVQLADLATGAIMSPLFYAAGFSAVRRVREIFEFLRVLERFGPATDDVPGIARHVTDDLCEPGAAWFERHGLHYVRDVLLPIAGGAQFGPLVKEVPALYVVRLLTMLRRYPLLDQLRLRMPQLHVGHERVWNEIAKRHDVRFAEPVMRLSREIDPRKVCVETPKATYWFDRVVVALSPQAYLRIADDLGNDERTLFSSVRALDRVILTARVSGLPGPLFLVPRYGPDGAVPSGHPYLLYEVDEGSGVYTFHPYLDDGASMDDAERAVRDVVAKLGGRVEAVLQRRLVRDWFPHFAEADMRAGAYAKLEALQGERKTFFVGELWSGVGVPHGTEYAADIARRLAREIRGDAVGPVELARASTRKRDAIIVALLALGAMVAIASFYRNTLLCFGVITVLALVSASIWRSRSDRILCLTGLCLGVPTEALATSSGLWTYSHPDIGTLPLWTAPMWWMFPIAVTRLVHAAFGQEMPSRPARTSAVAIALLVPWLCLIGPTRPGVALLGTVAVLAFLFSRGVSRPELGALVIGGLLGPIVELVPVRLGAWHYPVGGPLGLPIWLLPGYGAFGLALVRLGIRLGEPRKHSGSFTPVQPSETALVCQPNISAKGRRLRRGFGILNVAVAIGLAGFFAASSSMPWPWRTLMFVPVATAALSFFEVSRNTCVLRAALGTIEHDDLSTHRASPEELAASRKVSWGIHRDAVLVGLLGAALGLATALLH